MSGERNIDSKTVPFDKTGTAFNQRDVQSVLEEVDAALVTGVANLASHEADTSTHGVSGAIVGTGDSQDLSNKKISLRAGSAGAGEAPLKFASGTSLTTPEAGAIEFDGTDFFITPGATRYRIATLTRPETLSAKTLSTPIIGSFSNANHDHSNSNGGAQLSSTAFANDAIPYGKLQNVAAANRFLGSVGAGADIAELTALQSIANLITGLGVHYAMYYGGAVTLASGSDTDLLLGTTVLASSTFSLASNVITVANAQVAMLVFYSVQLNATVSGQAQVSVEITQDPNTGTFAVLTGSRKECCVDASNTSLDRNTVNGFFLASPGASYKYKLTGQIRSGAATVATVAAGTSILIVGLSNA